MHNNTGNERKPYWDGHRERLRERMRLGGLEALRPHEVLEVLLSYVMPRVDLSEVCRALVAKFGTVDAALNADRQRLQAVGGVTRQMADWLLLAGETIEAYRGVDQRRQFHIWRFSDMLDYLVPQWRSVPPPQTWVILTGQDGVVLSCVKLGDSLYIGGPECAREILEDALMLEARFVYLVGFFGVEPLELYDEEYEYIQSLSRLLAAIDVRLMDFVLVGEAGFLSLTREGRFDAIRLSAIESRLRERFGEGIEEDEGHRPLHEGEPGAL